MLLSWYSTCLAYPKPWVWAPWSSLFFFYYRDKHHNKNNMWKEFISSYSFQSINGGMQPRQECKTRTIIQYIFHSHYIESKTQTFILVCYIPNKEVYCHPSVVILMLTNDSKEYFKAIHGLWNVGDGRATVVPSSDGSWSQGNGWTSSETCQNEPEE